MGFWENNKIILLYVGRKKREKKWKRKWGSAVCRCWEWSLWEGIARREEAKKKWAGRLVCGSCSVSHVSYEAKRNKCMRSGEK